ncbi:MAG: class I SAM-dependent methyltransferase, partial [Actinomycetota bacterium]|nr:class I SAM-dependent methyltransferase [Actinomycetota bacterium]
MLPDAIAEHWDVLESHLAAANPALARSLASEVDPSRTRYDRRTRANFSQEWQHHELGDKTWGMDLDFRVKTYFLDSIRIPQEELAGKVMLDAGCGNGSQSVAYTEFGLEVVALDLSSGIEHGQAFRHHRPKARPDKVHFVQGDLQNPPLRPSTFDIIHSAGVLHHTPHTYTTFRRLCPLLRPSSTFYVWLYRYEPVVTPLVNALREVTTRLPQPVFAEVARRMSGTFSLFCSTLDRLGIREYPPLTRREATLALHDIFGAPYAHYHSFDEVAQWLEEEGFDEIWPCNETRRGFGICGRRTASLDQSSQNSG